MLDERYGGGNFRNRFAAEVDIGFVDDDGDIGMCACQALDVGLRQQTACRRVRVGENNGTASALGGQVIVNANGELVIERYTNAINAVQLAIGGIETVADVRREQWPVVLE